jgi:hypothetical protein
LHKFTNKKKKREKKRQKIKGVVYKEGGKFGAHEKNTHGEVVNYGLNGAR